MVIIRGAVVVVDVVVEVGEKGNGGASCEDGGDGSGRDSRSGSKMS